MLKRLNHVALAVPDLAAAVETYRTMLGARVSEPVALPEYGVTVAFVELDGSKIELLEPLGDDSPIVAFLRKHPSGGMHHVCCEVDDIEVACADVAKAGGRVLGDGRPRIGAHGKPVVFVHPAGLFGTLVELEEA